MKYLLILALLGAVLSTVELATMCDPVIMEHATVRDCLRDYVEPNRLLQEYTMSARQKGLANVEYVGPIDWADYDTFLPDLICKCAVKALALEHRFFGIQFYGECWSAQKLRKPRRRVNNCVNENFNMCNLKKDKYCTGRRLANAVYAFRTGWFNQNKGK